MPRPTPSAAGLALNLLRCARGWSQVELARAAGLGNREISRLETGATTLGPERLGEIAGLLGFGPAEVREALAAAERLLAPAGPPEDSLVPLTPEERRAVEEAAARAGRAAAEETRSSLAAELRARRAREQRAAAGSVWRLLVPLSPADRRRLLDACPELPTWALFERLCDESERAASDEPRKALALADLALRVAGQVPASPGERARLEGQAWAYLGNARRVMGDLPAADAAFARSAKLLRAAPPDPASPLDDARLLDLEASLRKDQRRFREALELLDAALARSPAEEAAGRLLLKKAATLELMTEFEAAIEALRAAAARSLGPRGRFAARFNLAVNLNHLGRHDEAAALLPEVRSLALGLGNGLDLVRVLWLEGRVAAGLGRREEALAALEQVRGELAARGIPYDTALVSLELAALLLQMARPAEVRRLARGLLWVFDAQGVHREALAALRLFCEAAEQERASAAFARRVADYLQRARDDPRTRFEP